MEVLDLVKRTLPIISKASCLVQADESTVYSDTKHLHYATLETEHPYKPSTVTHYQVAIHSVGNIGMSFHFTHVDLHTINAFTSSPVIGTHSAISPLLQSQLSIFASLLHAHELA